MLDNLLREAKRLAAEKNNEVIVYALHVMNVCKKGEGEKQCRFLAEEGRRHSCLKMTNYKETINEEVEKYEAGLPSFSGLPIGNNCRGVEDLEMIHQQQTGGF